MLFDFFLKNKDNLLQTYNKKKSGPETQGVASLGSVLSLVTNKQTSELHVLFSCPDFFLFTHLFFKLCMYCVHLYGWLCT